MSSEYRFKVDITCDGCVNAVKRSLQKTYGPQLVAVEADVSTQLVTVVLKPDKPLSYDDVYQAVSKSGKEVTKLQ